MGCRKDRPVMWVSGGPCKACMGRGQQSHPHGCMKQLWAGRRAMTGRYTCSKAA